ncbi:hypothetical protein H4R26_000714 [Coemansia thaxteri]|uniref:AA9 family lytic polysaccharide monooxygenase n=1 Tax=Coemansia thaxteri TaxID=2663907 RepID=A0A9W8EL68_9FUNG|nr:hypothetical protein H4R26_000714 [Coemansia thaxteri]KAJ2487801.1 hypothetical protein EV174_000334 [Coemansia sp. RSA 2320]
MPKTSPVTSVDSPDLVCRTSNKSPEATKILPVTAGSQLTVVWHHSSDADTDDVISPSHRGPCLVYMAPLESNGEGYAWFKIYEQGYDAATNLWCTDVVRQNHGKLNITIPTLINNGDYLLRTEMIALHNAKVINGAQFYPNCMQITVDGATYGSPDLYAIPGIYNANDPGIFFNVYASGAKASNYTIPGPPVYAP